ncbi:hypothetical protein LPJ56_003494, partial [Coemansia sp. RSA 2599]
YFSDDHKVLALTVSDDLFPLDIHYLQEPCENYVTSAVETVLRIHAKEDPGNILVFLPDKFDIRQAIQTLEDQDCSAGADESLIAVPLHAEISAKEQSLAFDLPPSGSQLFPARNAPETCRLSLASMALTLKALGVDNLVRFDYLQPTPPPEQLSQALEQLVILNAIDQKSGKLTADLGMHLAQLPLDLELGACLLNSVRRYKCAREAIAAISMLAIDADPFKASYEQREEAAEDKGDFMVQQGDVLTLANVLFGFQDTPRTAQRQWCKRHFLDYRLLEQADRISRQLVNCLLKLGYKRGELQISSCDQPSQLQKCLVSGLFANAACRNDDAREGKYRLLSSGLLVDIHPSSIFFGVEHAQLPEYVVFVKAKETKRLHIRGITRIEPEWLTEIAPHFWNIVNK